MQVRSVLTLVLAILALASVPSSAAEKSTLGANPTLSISSSPAIRLSNLPNQSIDFLNRAPASGPKYLSLKLDQELLCVDFASMPSGSPVGLQMVDRNNDSVLTLQPFALPTSQTLIWGGITSYDYFTNGSSASQLRIASTNGALACCILQPADNAGCYQGTAGSGVQDVLFRNGFEESGTSAPDLTVQIERQGIAPYVLAPGSTFAYAIRVTNQGNQAVNNVRVRDWFPKSASVFSARFQGSSTWDCAANVGANCGNLPNPRPVNVSLDGISLNVGASVTINVSRTVDVSSPIGPTFTLSAAAFAPPTPNAEIALGNNQSMVSGTTGVLNYTTGTSSLSFPNTFVNVSSAVQNVGVTAGAGNSAALQISCDFIGTHAANFRFSPLPSFPLSVPAGTTVNLPVQFTPSAPGARSASLSCQTNATAPSPPSFGATLSGTGVEPNTAPTIGAIAGQSTLEDTATGSIAFTATDLESTLVPGNLSCTSNLPAVVDASSCAFGGSEAGGFTLFVTPKENANGAATVTVTVNDGSGAANATASTNFSLTVTAVNDAPNFTLPPNRNFPAGTTGPQGEPNFITALSPGGGPDESGQTVSFTSLTLVDGSATIFETGGLPIYQSGGNLLLFNLNGTSGSATYRVRVEDNGTSGGPNGDVNFREKNFTITVLPAN